MTYRELLKKLACLTENQLDCDVTVEIQVEDECFPAEFSIAGSEHSCLDEDHPVILVKS